MTIKTPVKATFTGSDVTGLAEFQSADFIGVVDGGTGAVTFTSNSILLGNGTDAIQSSPIQISGSTISVSDSTTITIDEGLSVTGTITSGNLLPPTDNTGVVGNNSFTWNNGQFTDLTVDDVLTVRTAIDLADGDILRFGTNDDWELFHDGTANRIDLNVGDLTIRDGITTRFTFGRTTGDFTATGNIALQSSITFEGSTADDFETTLGVIDPTADRTINLPNVSGTIITTGNISDITGLSNSQLSNPSFTLADDSSTTTTISLGETLKINGTSNEIETAISGDTLTIGLPSNVTIGNNLTVTGDLTVNGTTTTVNSTTIEITNSFTFEGSTADDFETTLGVIDPTADRTINLPNVSGTLPVLAVASTTQITATPEELNYSDGVTSNIQTQIDSKASQAFAIAQAVALG
jgi:hypothetical protein